DREIQPELAGGGPQPHNARLACLGLAVLSCLQLGLQWHLGAAPETLASGPPVVLDAFPGTLGPWQGRPHPEARQIAEQAAFADQRGRMQRTTVYYWHYTIFPPREGLSLLQSVYLRQQERLPSVSVQVQVNVTDPQVWKTIEATLLPEVDGWLRNQLPATARV